MKYHCKTESDLLPAAAELIRTYPDSKVFAVYGEMGAGKTTLIKAICNHLGALDIVQSPSFAIINEYRTASDHSLFHFDFYRITKLEEAYDIGYEDYFYSGSYCFIEWPELVEALLPETTVRISISGEQERVVEF